MLNLSDSPSEDDGKLKPEDIRFVAMEGGGGKGFAYVGAVQALEQLGVMKNVKGFGGASAGAIMSLLLSIGYDSGRLRKYMEKTDFVKFFDLPDNRRIPRVLPRSYPRRVDSEAEKKVISRILALEKYGPSSAAASSAIFSRTVLGGWIDFLTGNKIDKSLSWLDKQVADMGKEKPPIGLLPKYAHLFSAYMPRDMGLFSGYAARVEFDRLINDAAGVGQGSGEVVTFKKHHEIFGNTLLVTGTNLSNGQTQLFSWRDTPDFPVADAIRISMSLPFIYKPYVITEVDGFDNKPHCGTYVDGGVWNNIPFREFDDEPLFGGDAKQANKPRTRTLGLRLEITEAKPVTDFWAFLQRYAGFGLGGSGESQISDRFDDQMVLLDVTGLSLIDFNPPTAVAEASIKRAFATTLEHFKVEMPANFLPPEDRSKTAELLSKADLCHPGSPSDRQLFPFIDGASGEALPGDESVDLTETDGTENLSHSGKMFVPVAPLR